MNQIAVKLIQDIGTIADSEVLMKRLSKYVSRLVKEKEDQTLLSKEQYLEKIENAEKQIAAGEGMEILPGEDLTSFLERNGYEI